MTVVAIHSRRAARLWFRLFPFIAVAVVLALAATGIYTGISRYYRGKYAGFHYDAARRVAINALVVKYGRDTAAGFRFADPPVVNTHSRSIFIDGQIRVFHLYGRQGTRYCISVWGPGYYWTGSQRKRYQHWR
jgi:hypothetical protein